MQPRLALISTVALIALASGLAAADYVVDDGNGERTYVVADDEGAVRAEDGSTAVRTRAVGDEAADPVLYEAGLPRSPATRRVVTRELIVHGDRDAAAELAKSLHAGAPEPTFIADRWLLRVADGATALAASVRLRQAGVVADPVVLRLREKRFTPNDPLLASQWHLSQPSNIDLDAPEAWDITRGAGINIALVDDGLQVAHPDLSPNCPPVSSHLHHDFNGGDDDPSPSSDDHHGTACAGLAAARDDNGIGVTGVAPRATLFGVRILAGSGASDLIEGQALAWRSTAVTDVVSVSSNSWGPPDDGESIDGPGAQASASLQAAVSNGRGGKGTIFVWAGGNGREDGDNSNYDGYANSPYTIAVAAVAKNGTWSTYSERGGDIVISAPSSAAPGDTATGIVTTDLVGADGYSTTDNGATPTVDERDYATDFGGTSAATPQVAGVATLMLSVNPNLGWRDVQEILIKTAKKVDTSNSEWSTPNASGYSFNPNYGAGLADAHDAVVAAQTWTNLGRRVSSVVARTALGLAIPDNNTTGVTTTFTVPAIRVEHVQIHIVARHSYRGDLDIRLTSPSGRTTVVADSRSGDGAANLDWTFLDVHHWGENAAGTWTLRVSDRQAQDVGTLDAATLTVWGSNAPVDAHDDVATTAEDTPIDINVRANDVDPEADALTAPTVATAPAHGSATVTSAGLIHYVPAADYNGSDSFTYSVADPYGSPDTATVSITVTPVNDAPRVVITSPASGTVFPAGTTSITVAVTVTDPDGGAAPTVQVDDGATVLSTAPFAFTGSPLHAGVYHITASATDATALTGTAAITVTVGGAYPQIATTAELIAKATQAWTYAPAATGLAGPATWSLLTAPAGMTIDPTSGIVSWTPGAGLVGTHQRAQLKVDDGTGFDLQDLVIVVVPTGPLVRREGD